MGKMRVHLLAKELEIETKDLVAQLERLGIRGRRAQSSLEDEEVTRVRAALAAQEKPHVHVGEEKVVADRVVTADDQSLGEIQARETIVERRVRANVIRRRTSRVEVVSETEKAPTQAQSIKAPVQQPRGAIEDLAATMPYFEEDSSLNAIAPEADISRHDEMEIMPGEIEEPSAPNQRGDAPSQTPAIDRETVSATPAPPPAAQTAAAPAPANEAPRGARVLGRI